MHLDVMNPRTNFMVGFCYFVAWFMNCDSSMIFIMLYWIDSTGVLIRQLIACLVIERFIACLESLIGERSCTQT